jgi:hypothetical protein
MTFQYIGRGILFAAAGFALLWNEMRNLRSGAASRDWPSTTGKVVARDVDPGAPIARFDSSLRLVYRYSVQGADYESSRIDFVGRYGGSSHDVAQGLRRYGQGEAVTVYYNPRNPGVAVLEPGVASRIWFRALFGAFLLVMGLILMV